MSSALSLLQRPRRSPALAPFIERLWHFEGHLEHRLERVLPDGRLQLLVNLDADELRTYHGARLDRVVHIGGAALGGARERAVAIDTAEQRCIVGVSFYVGGAVPVFRQPAESFTGAHVELDQLCRTTRTTSSWSADIFLQSPLPGACQDCRMTQLHVQLIVEDADAAMAFYQKALGAKVVERFRDEAIGKVVHAAMDVDGIVLSLADEGRAHGNHAPGALGGTPVILTLTVDEADVLATRMTEAGAEVIFPVADRFYGKREGRLRDPFGHVWIVSQPLEELSPDEIQRRVDAFHG